MSIDGHAFGLPLGWKSLALFYRADRWKQAPATTDALFSSVEGGYALAYETGSFYFHAAFLHSFGGQIATTLSPAADAIITVGAQGGYVGRYDAPRKQWYAAVMRGLIPAITRGFGYLPGWIGLGEDLPPGVARQRGLEHRVEVVGAREHPCSGRRPRLLPILASRRVV